jgi:hypothetical protein
MFALARTAAYATLFIGRVLGFVPTRVVRNPTKHLSNEMSDYAG